MNTRLSLQPRYYLIFAICSAALLHFACFGFFQFSFPNKTAIETPSVYFLGSILRKHDLIISRDDNFSYQKNLAPTLLNFTPATDTRKNAINEAPHKPLFSKNPQNEKKQAFKPFWAKTTDAQKHRTAEQPALGIESSIPPPEPLKLPNP